MLYFPTEISILVLFIFNRFCVAVTLSKHSTALVASGVWRRGWDGVDWGGQNAHAVNTGPRGRIIVYAPASKITATCRQSNRAIAECLTRPLFVPAVGCDVCSRGGLYAGQASSVWH